MDSELSCFLIVVVGIGILLSLTALILGGIGLLRIGALQKTIERLEWERHQASRPTAPVPPVMPAAAAHATAVTPVPAATPAVPRAPIEPQRVVPKPGPQLPSWTPPSQAERDRGLAALESNIGQRWIAWVGAIVVFLSVVFFLKYAFQNDWIGPTGQVVISAMGGVILAAAGSYFITKKWRIFGQCLMGLGLAILYASFYGAFQLYKPPVLEQHPAFAFMILVTVAGMTLAVLHDAVSMAFLAVLGGILTPVLVSTGEDSRDVLFTYMLILDLGVMGVAFYRGWRLLDTLAMVGTFLMYMGWWGQFYKPEGLWPAVGWLGAFYVIFLLLPFVYHLVRKQVVTVERFGMAVANAAFFASFAWYMLKTEYLHTMGFVALGMAAAYLVLGALLRKRVPLDVAALFGTITMTVAFLTLAVPMQLHLHGIMLAWVIEAPVLAFLAYRFRYEPLRALAFLVLVVAVGRLFGSHVHWPLHSEAFVPFANKQFLSAMAVPVAAWLYAMAHLVYQKQRTTADYVLQIFAALGGGFLALVILDAEVRGWLQNDYSRYAAACAVTALWALGAIAYVGSSRFLQRGAAPAAWAVALLALLIGAVLGLDAYGEKLATAHILFGNFRFGAWLLLMAGAFGLAWTIQHAAKPGGPETGFAIAVLVASLVALLTLLSTEVYTFCTDVMEDWTQGDRAGQMSISLVWSLYATGLLWVGFWRRWRWVRWGGLALFGLAALKLMIYDLSFLKDLNRIISFLVLGMLMLGASYVYHKLEKRLGARDDTPDTPATPSTPATSTDIPPAAGEPV